jgi:hypothetical protein
MRCRRPHSWTNDDIWLRQSFDSETDHIQAASLVIFHDEDTEVYVNGQLIWKRGGYTTAYEAFGVTEALQKALRKGRNLLAVHTHQTVGGQFIDLALLCEPRDNQDRLLPAQTLQHRYSFTSDASDSVGGANGTLVGNAYITNNALVLPGGGNSDNPSRLCVNCPMASFPTTPRSPLNAG